MAITETKTKYGQIHGVPKDGYTVFRGVPYAKPPVGENASARRKSGVLGGCL